jgi:hypothetical protein
MAQVFANNNLLVFKMKRVSKLKRKKNIHRGEKIVDCLTSIKLM